MQISETETKKIMLKSFEDNKNDFNKFKDDILDHVKYDNIENLEEINDTYNFWYIFHGVLNFDEEDYFYQIDNVKNWLKNNDTLCKINLIKYITKQTEQYIHNDAREETKTNDILRYKYKSQFYKFYKVTQDYKNKNNKTILKLKELNYKYISFQNKYGCKINYYSVIDDDFKNNKIIRINSNNKKSFLSVKPNNIMFF